jgi:hypothetical protein
LLYTLRDILFEVDEDNIINTFMTASVD